MEQRAAGPEGEDQGAPDAASGSVQRAGAEDLTVEGVIAEDLGEPRAEIGVVVTGDSLRRRETMRGVLAAWSFAVFTLVVGVMLFAVVSGWRTWDELEGLATSVLPVVVSVLGATTGFYFGLERGREEDGRR